MNYDDYLEDKAIEHLFGRACKQCVDGECQYADATGECYKNQIGI